MVNENPLNRVIADKGTSIERQSLRKIAFELLWRDSSYSQYLCFVFIQLS